MMRSVIEVHSFLAAVTQLGGTPPPTLTSMLTNYQTLLDARPDMSDPLGLLLDAATGPKLTPTTATELLVQVSTPRLVSAEATQLLGPLELRILQRITNEMRGDLGDEMIGSLRPTVDNAVAGLHAAADQFPATATAEQILELGEGARQAWLDLDKHRRTLDSILANIVRPLTFGWDLLPPDAGLTIVGQQTRLTAVWLVDRDLDRAGVILSRGNVGDGRAGRWLDLLRVSAIRLHTPTEALAIVTEMQTSIAEETQRKNAELEQMQRLVTQGATFS